MAQAEREHTTSPFVAFRYEVKLTLRNVPDGVNKPVCDAAFSECSGLEMTMEPKTIPNMGRNLHQEHRIQPVSYGRLTLKRGMTQNLDIWHWFVAAATPGTDRTADGQIIVSNADNTPALTFSLEECLPVKVSGPSLNAQTGQIAMEELQLVYKRLSIKLPDQAGTGTNTNVGKGLRVSGGPGLSSNSSDNSSF